MRKLVNYALIKIQVKTLIIILLVRRNFNAGGSVSEGPIEGFETLATEYQTAGSLEW